MHFSNDNPTLLLTPLSPPTPNDRNGGYGAIAPPSPHQKVESLPFGYIVAVFNLKPITKQDLSCSQGCFLKPKLYLQQTKSQEGLSGSVFKGESLKKFLFQPHTDHHKSKSTPFKKNDGKQHVH